MAAMLDALIVMGAVGGALASLYAGVTALTNLVKSVREYRETGDWEFTDAKRQRARMIRELRRIS